MMRGVSEDRMKSLAINKSYAGHISMRSSEEDVMQTVFRTRKPKSL